jgi:hypothetical protein
MVKALKSQQEIEALLLSELRQAEGCAGATAVLIYPLANERATLLGLLRALTRTRPTLIAASAR